MTPAEQTLASLPERFASRINLTEGCWLWTGSRNGQGYGCFSTAGATVLVHRFAYESLIGPIPEGLVIDHLCRVRECVNPAHMEAVTQRENVLRGEGVAAGRARMTHCHMGHEFTSDNTYRSPSTPRRRQCRACAKARTQQKAAA